MGDGDRGPLLGKLAIAAQVLIALIALLHVYFVSLETVLFKTRGRRVFGLSAEKAEIMAPAMSNQGCYNGLLVAALVLGLLHPDAAVGRAFAVYASAAGGDCAGLAFSRLMCANKTRI
ncbi:DUF1304 family protein [Massilia sp. TWR1-2-2]|uniref:DUF1304 family protein n=1 Tax=Massilia sp. TWR1-2-2 TaxID=2804584 RepID=UPI003CF0C578